MATGYVTDTLGEKLVINMGPSHPATHGVLRLVLELDGEIITKATPDIGYLHRGDEKIAENMHYNQFVPYTDRLDYLAPLANNVAYALAVEKLMGWTLPPRGQAIRVICCELARISSHLLGVGCFAMDCGAMTVFLYTFTEREKIYNLSEQLTGARFTTSYTRIGGMTRDLPDGFVAGAAEVPRRTAARHRRDGQPALAQPHLRRSHEGHRHDHQGGRDLPSASPARICAAAASITTCAKSIPISATSSTSSTCRSAPWATATIATSCAWRRCGSRSASCTRCSTRCPAARSTCSDAEELSAAEDDGADEDGGADPPLHHPHRRHRRAGRAKSTSAQKIRRANSAFTSTAKAAARRTG